MHRFVILGINHKFAPLEVRERLAYADRRLPAALRQFKEKAGCAEVVIVSTCNRVEVYAFTEAEDAKARLLGTLADDHNLKADYLDRYCYFHRGREAVEHLMRVAGGLDSLVLGETQIRSQVKRAYLLAQSENATGKALNGLFHHVFSVVKRLHTETGISQGQLSVSSIAVRFIKRVFERLSDKTALLIGAGEVGELTLTYLKEEGIGRVIVISRTLERAVALASRFQGDAVPFDLLEDYLPAADILITQTAAEGTLIDRKMFKRAMRLRAHRSVFALDLAVPRDIHADVGRLDGVYLYNVDDLEGVVSQHAMSRSAEISRCHKIIAVETEAFLARFHSLSAGPLITALRERGGRTKDAELERLLARLADLKVEQKEEIAKFAQRLLNKLLHPMLTGLKAQAARSDAQMLQRIAQAMGIDGTEEGARASGGAAETPESDPPLQLSDDARKGEEISGPRIAGED